MQPSPPTPNHIHPGLTGNPSIQLGMGIAAVQVCPLSLPKTIPPFLLRELGHELKTPLTGLLGLAQLFRADIKPNTQRQSQCANLIYQKAQQLLIAIYDLMDLSQLSCQQFNLNVQPVELSQVMQAAWQTAIAQYDEAHLCVTPVFQMAAEQIIADEIRLKQLLIHLMSHFILHLPKDSGLKLDSYGYGSWRVIRCHAQAYWMPEFQQTLLSQWHGLEEPSTQTFSDISTNFKLLLVDYLARLQGGTAFLRSDESCGTEYIVLLPQDITASHSATDYPLLIVLLSTDLQIAQSLSSLCQAENILMISARSLEEVQTHLPILQNTGVVIDSQFQIESSAFQNILEHSGHLIKHLALLEQNSTVKLPEGYPWGFKQIEHWPKEIATAQISQTLQRWKTSIHRDFESSPSSSTRISPDPVSDNILRDPYPPLTLLQVDSPVGDKPEFNDSLFNQLSVLYRCSIVTADHVEQADLLSRVWSPDAVICTTTLSTEDFHLLEESSLAIYPIVLVGQTQQAIDLPTHSSLKLYSYTHSSSPDATNSRLAAKRLYQFLIKLI